MSAIDLEEFAATGSTGFKLGARDEKWDGGEAEKSYELPGDSNCWMYRDPDGDASNKSSYKLPFVSKDGGKHAVWGAITAIAQRLSSTKGISDADMAAIKKRVESYYAKARKEYDDDSIKVPWADDDSTERAGAELFSAIVPLTFVEVRDPSRNPDNTWTFSGYASVFNQQAIYLDSKWLRVMVEVDPGAFDELMRTQRFDQPDGVVHYNRGHNMDLAVAATDVPAGQPGSLQLGVDAHGLRYLAKSSKDDPDAVALAVKLRDGVVKQASMAFMVGDQQIVETETDEGPDIVLRKILTVSQLFDVCACPQGVFSQTVSELQEFAAPLYSRFGHPGAVALGGHPRQLADGEGASVVIPDSGGGASHTLALEAEAMRMRLAQRKR